MTGVLIFAGVVAVIVIVFRYWRKREIEAFLETDMSALEELNITAERSGADSARRERRLRIANMPPAEATPAATPEVAAEEPAPTYYPKDEIFDDVHRSCLQALDKVLDGHHRLFVHLPLRDLAHSDDRSNQSRLMGATVSFLLCDRDSLGVICGIQLKGAGVSELERHAFVEDVFRQIGKPLMSLPMRTTYSTLELEESLAHILGEAGRARHCPKCGQEMLLRQAVKGKNAGKNFWVCREFPGCKGIMRISRS